MAQGDDRILFAGALFGAQKDAIYRGAYLFVLPSTIEGMALVLLEAMSYGKGCLCSDIDENMEVADPAFEPGQLDHARPDLDGDPRCARHLPQSPRPLQPATSMTCVGNWRG